MRKKTKIKNNKKAFSFAEIIITLGVCGVIGLMSMDFMMTTIQDKKELMKSKNFTSTTAAERAEELTNFTAEQYKSQMRVKGIHGESDLFTVPANATETIQFNRQNYFECQQNITKTTYRIVNRDGDTVTLEPQSGDGDTLEANIPQNEFVRFDGLTAAIEAGEETVTPRYYCIQHSEDELYTFQIAATTNERKFKFIFYNADIANN